MDDDETVEFVSENSVASPRYTDTVSQRIDSLGRFLSIVSGLDPTSELYRVGVSAGEALVVSIPKPKLQALRGGKE